ncbi:MAG: hypothetical protein DMG63_13560 [Acidobacteria bacterium]|nr:MAG: hypothetical protein DMG63_13560 [Acidobacteriota bacterium]
MFARRTEWNLVENRFAETLRSARASGAELLDLTVSNPTRCNFKFDSERILTALSHAGSLNYDPDAQGLLLARKAVAEYYNASKVRGNAAPGLPEQIFLTTSTSEAYSYLFRLLCDPGDEVLVPRPSYPLFDYLADIQDIHLRAYELFYDHGWHVDFGGLQRLVTGRTRAVLVVNPNNPTGSFVQRSELDQLTSISDTYLSVNAPIQHAAQELLKQKDQLQPQLVQRVRANLKFLDQHLRTAQSIQRLKVEGGWYAIVRIPAKKSDEDVAIELISRAGVVVHPGHFYDFPHEGYLVVSLITPEDQFQKGIRATLEIAA